MSTLVPDNEFERVVELSEMDLDYGSLDEYLQDLTLLAAKISGTPVSLVNLIDSYTQWTVSAVGYHASQINREDSICQYTMLQDHDLEIKNLKEDSRFSDKDYAGEGKKLTYYYGIPLKTKKGLPLGALCMLDEHAHDLEPEKKDLLQLIANDIVERLLMLKHIHRLQGEVDELKSTRRKLSHDVRGPVGGIIGLTDILKEDIHQKRMDEVDELIALIRKGGESVLELSEEILEEETESPVSHTFTAHTFSQKLKDLFEPQARSKQIGLQIQTGDESASLSFPRTKLLQIAGNLISNAIKFTPKGGKVEVFVSAAKKEMHVHNELKIRVSDTGLGIDPLRIKEISEGKTFSNTGTEGERGYGFGLSLVQHLVSKAGGTCRIESPAKGGTTCLVTLPIAKVE